MADDIRLVLSVDDRDLLRARKEQEKYQYRIAQIEKEFRKGTITSSRYNKELAKQARELAKLGGGYNKANSEIRKYAYSLRNATDDQLNLAQAMTKSGKGMRRMEILAQQAGYQIGDFAVQVQSGTNVAVAFGQQASQLLGFFGPMGAVAGAGIAIGTGLIAPLLNAKGATRDLSEELEELETSLGKVAISAEASISAGLTANLVAAQSAVNELVSRMQSEDFQRAMSFAGASTASGQVAQTMIEAELQGRRELVGSLEDQIGKAGILEAQERVRKALIGDQAQEAQNVATAKRLVLALDEKNKVAAEKLEKLEQGRADAIKAQFDARMASIQANDRANAQAEVRQKAADSSARDRLRLLMQQNAVLDLQLKYGSDSEKIETLRNAHTVANLRASLEKQGVDQSIVDVLVDQQNKLLINKAVLKDMNEEAAKFKELMKIDYIAIDPESQLMEMSLKPSKQSGPNREPKGPKKTTIEDTIKSYRRQMATEQALMSFTGQRRREEELFLELKYANQDADIKTSETRLRGLAQEMSAMEERSRKIEEARQQQEDLKNTIESSMGDAFMSIVDGTKTVEDAFRDMARQIIAELYRVLVVKRMVSAVTGFFGFADGGAFQGGSQIQAYANGGVVGSPTYFPMAGGRTGLMGEAGPEAIMPLKRGKDGKLGVTVDGNQQQSVVINQSFNFAANGDDSVKRIIAQQAPKIAQMTQQQIMDSRRRGGQMKAVFG